MFSLIENKESPSLFPTPVDYYELVTSSSARLIS